MSALTTLRLMGSPTKPGWPYRCPCSDCATLFCEVGEIFTDGPVGRGRDGKGVGVGGAARSFEGVARAMASLTAPGGGAPREAISIRALAKAGGGAGLSLTCGDSSRINLLSAISERSRTGARKEIRRRGTGFELEPRSTVTAATSGVVTV